MPVPADNDVVVHGNAERLGDIDDRLGHVDVGARRRRVATRMIVHQSTGRSITLISFVFKMERTRLGTVMVIGKNRSFVIVTYRHAASD